jgi:hypothetical protein
MSFYVEFTAASRDDALRIIVAEELLPDSVRTFICQALEAHHTARAIYVKATGHLYSRDYDVSSAEIVVREIKLRYPRSGPLRPGHDSASGGDGQRPLEHANLAMTT